MTETEIKNVKIGDTLFFVDKFGDVKSAIVDEHELNVRFGDKIKVNVQYVTWNHAIFHRTREDAESFAREKEIKSIQIFLDLRGTPSRPDSICLSTSHGYYAYVDMSVDSFVYKLFKEMSIWGGSTKSCKTRDSRYFDGFELDCADKAFFKSRSFRKICGHHNVKFVIMDNGDDTQMWRDFWDQMQQ